MKLGATGVVDFEIIATKSGEFTKVRKAESYQWNRRSVVKS